MGGRGSSSGISSGKGGTGSLPVLEGTEKQVAWAKQIREDAINTVNSNIASLDERYKKHGFASYKESASVYKDLKKQLFESLNKEKSAAAIINNRNKFDPSRINFVADEMLLRKKNRK